MNLNVVVVGSNDMWATEVSW